MNASPTTPNHKGHDKDTNFTMRIKPNFDLSTIQADDIKAEAEHHLKVASDNGAATKNPFPVDAFPLLIQQIITATNESLNFPIDFIGSSLLYAGALAIGNSHIIQAKNTWSENAVLYLAIVGKAGTNKSHPLSFALKPLQEENKKMYKDYEEQKKEYDYYKSLNDRDKEKEGLSEPDKPFWKKYIVSDVTPESLAEVHQFNKRGVGLYSDELAGWFKNFNRYNKGSEETFWLSSWSGKEINIDRKNGGPVFIYRPFIPVIGTIQNGVLKELSGNGRNLNGFIDRILFTIPDKIEKAFWSDEELDNSVIEHWQKIILKLLELPCLPDETGNPDPKVLKFSPEAKRIFVGWHDKNEEIYSGSDSDAIAGINAKMKSYALRFALTLELLQWACGESEKNDIGVEAINGAIKLAEYFRNTALRVHEIVSDPLASLTETERQFYFALPENFTTAEGSKVADNIGIKRRTFDRYIKNSIIYKKIKQGHYEKLV